MVNTAEKEIYYKGYVVGYRAGMRDAINGHTIEQENFCAGDIPIRATELSTRVKNCLLLYGCVCLRDAAELDADRIKTMHNFGPKAAAEVAHYLDGLGICYSAWNAYL